MKTTLPQGIKLLRVTLCALLIMFSLVSFSQNTAGRDFWLAQTPNLSGASFTNAGFSISVSNLGTAPASISITNPARATVNAVVQPNALQMFTFTSENENIQTTGIYSNNVYHITSNNLVVVNSYTPLTNVISNDGALIFPIPALGKRYMVASYISSFTSANSPAGYASSNAFYTVVANQNGTNVKVYNTAGILVDNVNLNQGQCYQRMNGATPANDVTGYYVESTKPVSVFSGTQATAVGTHQNAQDHIYEQILPIETLSNSYLAAPSNNRPINCTTCTEDIFRYVATEDNTVITTSPNVGSATLNKGQYLEVFTSMPHVVKGTKPFYGYQYLTSQRSGTVQGLTGDPDLIGMPVVDQFLFTTVFAIPNTFDYNFVTVTAPTGINLSIDDTVRNPVWRTVGVLNGITYKTTSIKVYPGSHKINGDKKLGFYTSSFSNAASISYMGGSGMEPINAGCITGGPYLVTTCVPGVKQVQLNGTATCTDGSTPTSVLWTSEDGVVFSDPTIANPIATLPGNGRYNISLTVNCSGNSISCSSEIAVTEPIGGCSYYPAPTLDAPPYKLLPTDNNQSYASNVALGTPVYTSTGFTTITNDAPAHFPVGTTVVTWTLRDALDRIVSDTQHVTVFPPPTIQAPADVTVNSDPGLTTASGINTGTPVYVSYYGPTTLSNTAIAVYPTGNTPVIYSVTDGFGRTASDTQIVTVLAPPPTITAPPTVTVIAGFNGFASGVDLRANGNESYTASVNPATVSNNGVAQYPIGITNVTWTVTDGLNRTASDVQQVIVEAPTPVIAPPADIIIGNDPGEQYSSQVVLVDPVFSAVNGVLTNDAPLNGKYPIGTTTVNWRLTDAYGHTINTSNTVTVISAPPTMVAPPTVTIIAGFNGFASGVDLRANGNESYTASVNPATVSNNGGVQYPIGTTNVTWTVTDGLNRTASDVQQVIVEAPKPVMAPPADIIIGNDPGEQYSSQVVLVDPVFSAVDGVLTNDAPLNGKYPIGTTTVHWRLTDGYGHTIYTSNTVTVLSAPPTIVAPAPITVTAGYNGYATIGSPGTPTTTVSVNPETVSNTGALAQYPIGTTSIIWTVTDGLNRTASDVQKVIVVAPKPVIAPPADIIISNDPGVNYSTHVVLVNPVFSVAGPYTLTNDAPANGQFPIGTTVVKWTLTDSYRNTVTTFNKVTVSSAPPTIVAPAPITVIAGYNGYAVISSLGTPITTVSVNPETVSNSGALTQYPIGSTSITWTVKDGLGRTASDVQKVIVLAPKPTLAPPADKFVSNDPGVTYATGVNLGLPVVQAVGPYTLTNDAPSQFPIGTTTVTWTLTDAYGNKVTVTQKVTVTTAPPTIVAPPAVTVNANPGQNYATGVAIGNATYTVSVNPASLTNNAPSQFPVGSTTVTWTIKDGLGRTASGTQIVTVKPSACQFTCTITSVPTDVTPTGGNPNSLYIGYGAQSTKLQVNVPNTGGPYTFLWTGSGLNNNTSAAPIFTPGIAEGNYTFYVAVKNASGCTSNASISICVRDVRSLDKNGKWDGKKVIVCHLPPGNPANVQMIDVSINAVPAHVPLHGGDGLGNTCIQPACSSPYARGTTPVVETFGVKVYPNPSNNAFALTVKSDDKYTDISVRIVDAFGRTVQVFNSVTAGRTVLFGDNYANGAYFAEVVQGSDRKMIPLMKAK